MPRTTIEREEGSESYPMSQRAYDKLRGELDTKRQEFIDSQRDIKDAGEGNDWHDNFAFEQAHRDFDVARERYSGVSQKVDRHTIIEPRSETDRVGIGNTVRVQFSDSDTPDTYHVLGQVDASLFDDSISSESPLGSRLIGRGRGETVEYEVGKSRMQAKIVEILPGRF